jgi:hypothetical protein
VEVNGLILFQQMSDGTYQPVAADSSGKSELVLSNWQLPEILQVTVQAGTDGSGVTALPSLTPDMQTDDTVAVPVVPKVC